jgi:protein SCO1/2
MMRTTTALLFFAVGLVPISSARVSAQDHGSMSHMQMTASKPLPGTSIYNLTSAWTDQEGKPVKLNSLRGEPLVVAMGYTSCKDICPMIVADMVAIEDRAKEASPTKIHFAFFSIDPVNDTPERLKAYSADHGMDLANWTLYRGDDKAVRELAAALGVRYRANASGGFDHSAIISLLDAEGRIAFQKADARVDIDEMVKQINALPAPVTR